MVADICVRVLLLRLLPARGLLGEDFIDGIEIRIEPDGTIRIVRTRRTAHGHRPTRARSAFGRAVLDGFVLSGLGEEQGYEPYPVIVRGDTIFISNAPLRHARKTLRYY
jgi:hypothetical protein